MATLNKKLPGFMFTYRDGGLVPAQLAPSTEALLIIGNALDGPAGVPVKVSNLAQAEVVFGPLIYSGDYLNPQTGVADGAYADNNLVKALGEAVGAGANNVYCVRAGGNTASVSNVLGITGATATAKAPGRIYNSVTFSASISGNILTFTINQPPSKGGTAVLTFNTTNTRIADFQMQVASAASNQTLVLNFPGTVLNNLISTLVAGTWALSGTTAGTNGTGAPGEDFYNNKPAYYRVLTQSGGIFDSIIDVPFDLALLVGVYGDDVVDNANPTTTSVANAFAQWLYNVSSETRPVYGFLGLRPSGLTRSVDLGALATNNYLNTSAGYYNQASNWINFGYFMNNGFYYTDPVTNQTVDIGRHLVVVAGPDCVFAQPEIGWYLENPAAALAGLASTLAPQNALTHKTPPNIKSLRGNFSKVIHEQLNQGVGYTLNPNGQDLGSGAYVTLKSNPLTQAIQIVSDNTCAQRSSDYASLQILRIVNTASAAVKSVLEPYIGQPNNVEARTAMKTQITSVLDSMAAAGALLGGNGVGYTFALSSDPVEMMMGQITVTLFLRPVMQIKYIRVIVSVGQ